VTVPKRVRFAALFPMLVLVFSVSCTTLQASMLRISLGEADAHPHLQSRTYIFGYFVNLKQQVDSLFTGNAIEIELNDSLPHGLYNVMVYTDLVDVTGMYQRLGFDLIYTGKDIDISVEISETRNYGNIRASSGENEVYFKRINDDMLREKREEALRAAIEQYPKGDGFHQQLSDQLERILEPYDDRAATPTGPGSAALFYLDVQHAIEYRDVQFFDFTSTWLKNSPFIPVICWNYLDEGEKDTDSPVSLSQRLIRLLAVLLPKLKADDEVKELMIGEIVRYYEKKGLNEVVLYINEVHVLPDVCENTELTDRLEEKNRLLKRLLVGQPAPNVGLNTVERADSLYEIKAQTTLLVFWESTCPHCQDVTDELAAFYNSTRSGEFEVVAVALDTSRAEFLGYLKEHDFKWLNEVDYAGWDSPVAQAYNVGSTPAMFLLDSDKTIIARPGSVAELKAFLPDY